MNAGKPWHTEEFDQKAVVPWDDHFIDVLKRALVAC